MIMYDTINCSDIVLCERYDNLVIHKKAFSSIKELKSYNISINKSLYYLSGRTSRPYTKRENDPSKVFKKGSP